MEIKMVNVIGVRFRQAGKVYYFAPGEHDYKRGDHVIVETARGVEYGEVILGNHEVEEIRVIQPLRSVMRPANEEDARHEAENKERQKEAFQICREKIRRHQLDMKLIDCEYTFDNSKILFYFTADGRIDFRELVKDLASVFRTRIELRQVGVRDETKLLGGIGVCGRPLCCNSYLSDFIPVSIKMAKEQNLSLNPTKISGVCGRLMCCLKNEEDVYETLNRRLPKPGDYVTVPDGLRGEVSSVSILKQLVKVVVTLPNDEKEIREYPVEELQFKPRQRWEKGKRPERGADGAELPQQETGSDEKELAELEQLEKLETEEVQAMDGENGGAAESGGRKRGKNFRTGSRAGRDGEGSGEAGSRGGDRRGFGRRERGSYQDRGERGTFNRAAAGEAGSAEPSAAGGGENGQETAGRGIGRGERRGRFDRKEPGRREFERKEAAGQGGRRDRRVPQPDAGNADGTVRENRGSRRGAADSFDQGRGEQDSRESRERRDGREARSGQNERGGRRRFRDDRRGRRERGPQEGNGAE